MGKRALSISKDYPALLLMPAFTIWAFGSSKKKSCFDCKVTMGISVSFTSTLINTWITIFGIASTSIFLIKIFDILIFYFVLLVTFCPLLISAILGAIVACIDK